MHHHRIHFYQDFEGHQISVKMSPQSLFCYDSAYDVLKKELIKRATKKLGSLNGLDCEFKNTRVETFGDRVRITGFIKRCEPDC